MSATADSAAQAPARPVFTHAQALRAIRGIALCILLSALDQTIVAPAIPRMAGDLGGVDGLSWIISAYLLTSTAGTPIIGKLSDIYGRRALMLASIVVFAVASALCGLAQTLPELIGFRALQGLGGAGLIGMAHATIADVVSPRERGRYQIYLSGMWGLASIAGPGIGGIMTDHLSWRAIFWVNLPLSLIAFVLSERALRILPPRPKFRARIDVPGAMLLTGAVVCGLVLITRTGQGATLLAPPTLALAAAGLAAIAALRWQEHRAADPILPPRLFAEPVVVRCLLLTFGNSMVTFATTLLLPLHFQLAHGDTAEASGLLLTPFLLAFVTSSYGAGQLARKLGRTRGIMSAAVAACAAGSLLLATIDATTPSWLTVCYSLLTGAGIGLVQPSITVTIQNAADPRDVGVATGSMLLVRSIGGAFGATMAGAIVAWNLSGDAAAAVLQGRAAALASVTGPARAGLQHAVDRGFHGAFAVCGAVCLISLALALTTRDIALRSR